MQADFEFTLVNHANQTGASVPKGVCGRAFVWCQEFVVVLGGMLGVA